MGGSGFLLDFLFQCVKFRCGKELAQSDIKTVANHLDS